MATKERISLNVNNKSYDLEVDPNMPLLYALRNELDVTGPQVRLRTGPVWGLYGHRKWQSDTLLYDFSAIYPGSSDPNH